MNPENLLPKSTEEFGKSAFWDRFFAQGESAHFEWYTDAKTLMPIIERYALETRDRIRCLIPGCGASNLAFYLSERGYANLYPCDYSDVALQSVRAKALEFGSALKFRKRDACKFSSYTDGEALEWFKPNSIDMIIDKGLLDSISSDMSEYAIQQCSTYLHEIKRLTKSNTNNAGTILIVTMAQVQVLDILHFAFPLEHWLFTVHFIPASEGNTNRFLPVVVALTPRSSLRDHTSKAYVLDYSFVSPQPTPDGVAQRPELFFDSVKTGIAEHQQQQYKAMTLSIKKGIHAALSRRSYCIEVKPADIDTDLNELRLKVAQLLMRFTEIHCESIKTQPVAFGLQKLVLNVTVTNSDKHGRFMDLDSVVEELQDELGEDWVQSIDVNML